MARILGVNGIYNWSWSKDSFTDKFLGALGHHHDVVDVKYPLMTAMFAYFEFAIKRRAQKILEVHRHGDVLVAHSFGCLVSLYAMRMGAQFSTVFYFGAAVHPDIVFPKDAFDKLYNVYSTQDTALTLGNTLPHHEFGVLGKYGYIGNDLRVVNIQAKGHDHNDYVLPRNLCTWVRFIEWKLREEET